MRKWAATYERLRDTERGCYICLIEICCKSWEIFLIQKYSCYICLIEIYGKGLLYLPD